MSVIKYGATPSLELPELVHLPNIVSLLRNRWPRYFYELRCGVKFATAYKLSCRSPNTSVSNKLQLLVLVCLPHTKAFTIPIDSICHPPRRRLSTTRNFYLCGEVQEALVRLLSSWLQLADSQWSQLARSETLKYVACISVSQIPFHMLFFFFKFFFFSMFVPLVLRMFSIMARRMLSSRSRNWLTESFASPTTPSAALRRISASNHWVIVEKCFLHTVPMRQS